MFLCKYVEVRVVKVREGSESRVLVDAGGIGADGAGVYVRRKKTNTAVRTYQQMTSMNMAPSLGMTDVRTYPRYVSYLDC